MRPEQWRPVLGYEGLYEVSSHARVRSIGAQGWLLPLLDRLGYVCVDLYLPDGSVRGKRVHRLMCEAFYGSGVGLVARHLDGDRGNNALSNLAWGTHSENMLDKQRHGTDHNRNKVVCPLGHPLVLPNLVSSAWCRRRRECLACARARAVIHQTIRTGWGNCSVDLRDVADRKLDELMNHATTVGTVQA